jgi:hypothetical protein
MLDTVGIDQLSQVTTEQPVHRVGKVCSIRADYCRGRGLGNRENYSSIICRFGIYCLYLHQIRIRDMQTNNFQYNNDRHRAVTPSYKEEDGRVLASEIPISTDNECLKNGITIDEFKKAISNHIYEYWGSRI